MGRFKEVLFAAIFALAFIFLTGYGATVGSGWLMEFCFMFHLYPFGLGFAGGGGVAVMVYYLILWAALTILFLGIKRLFILIFKPQSKG